MYYNEDLLLDLRLNSLDKFVKKFVITEATYTHNGAKKKLNFDINKFQKFKDKIIYIVVESQPKNILEFNEEDSKAQRGEKLILNGMARDYFQRESLMKGIQEANYNDLILISDLDEIPNLNNLDFSNLDNKIIIFEQKIFYYKLNLFYDGFLWHGTKATKKKNFFSPQWLRNVKGKNYPKWRIDTFFSKKKYSNIEFVKNGGWHFTNLKTAEQLEEKLNNFAHHYEFQVSGLKIDDIKRFIAQKRIIYDYKADQKKYKWSGESTLKKIDLKLLPDYVLNNKKNYLDWLD
tara:strand:- start:3260 stop:4129 length:870 start_codon:yes stop_codon:yes gene_type:complete